MRQWSHAAEKQSMQQSAIQLILEDHRALATVLRLLHGTVDAACTSAAAPDFERLRTMLFYLDEVPARVHHATESELLFPRIRERCPALRPVLDRLEADHERGGPAIRELERGLTAWQLMGDSRREHFQSLVHAFARVYLGHMEVEENYVLPVAGDYLSDADWRELDDALRGQRGTLTDALVRNHRALYERIVAAPSPVAKLPCKT
jgi:hemerythrin-like domain-containing protein